MGLGAFTMLLVEGSSAMGHFRHFFNLVFGVGNSDLNSVWARLPCCFSKCPLKRNFLDIYLTTYSESVIAEKKKSMRVIVFFKMFKI